MRADNWKIFDKKGSNLNPYNDSFLNFEFITDSQNARGATAYALTDPSSIIYDVVVTNTGWEYDPATEAKLTFSFSDYSEILNSSEVSINFVDVSIFNPEPNNSLGIGSLDIDVSTEFVYPAVIFTSATFMRPVSVDLIETEHLSIFEESSTGQYIRPYNSVNNILVFKFSDGDPEIKLFEVNQDTQTLIWTEELIYDLSTYVVGSPLVVNVGFKAADEGVFERKLRAFHRIDGEDFQIAEILINSQSIGQDERFDTIAQDFGLPNAKNFPKLFKEADINEDLTNWELVNSKSKHMVLDHSEITPYIGSYKALINAIKWLGYEDIKIKEWFRNVKDNTKLSLYIPYEAEDRTKTILYFSPEERKNLKKLNQLNLIYCITRETGEIDQYGNPLTEECYEYNVNEVLIKLRALKDWLEKNIIGVNARITDVTGEGVYFERFRNLIYGTQDIGNRAIYSMSLTPETIEKASELVRGDASISLTLKEIEETPISSFDGVRFSDLLQYYWDPSNGAFSDEDASALWWDPSTIAVGIPFKFPLRDLFDIQWKLSVEKTQSGVVPNWFVTNPLFVYDNELRFYNILDSSSVFHDVSANIDITLERGYLRNPNNDIWTESIQYSIYPNDFIYMDPSTSKAITYDSSYAVIDGSGIIYHEDSSIVFNNLVNPTYFIVDGSVIIVTDTSTIVESPLQNGYTIESSTGVLVSLNGEFSLQSDPSSSLVYAFDTDYNVPLLKIQNYFWTDTNGSTQNLDDVYNLDIVDGNIKMERFVEEPSSFMPDSSAYKEEKYFINFGYDPSLSEQKITLNVVYKSPKAPLYIYDPSIYYNSGPEEALIFDNSIYIMDVNHIGPYHVEIFGWDGQNNLYRNFYHEEYDVWTKFPTIWTYLDVSCGVEATMDTCPSALLTPADISALVEANLYPVFDRQVALQGLTLEQDINEKYYIKVPSISYFVDLPEDGAISRFYNMTELSTDRVGDVFTIDEDFQSFNNGDDVNLVLFDRGQYFFIEEVSGNITSIGAGTVTIPGIPSNFVTDTSTEVYLLNDTYRETANPANDLINKTVDIDISAYLFEYNQLVGILIDDVCTGYTWGSSFRVLDSSVISGTEGYHHTLIGNIPEFIIANPSRYEISAKHSYSTFADFIIDVDYAKEIDNNFHIYLDDYYYQQYYLDNTFVYVNVLFDQELVLDQWFDPSTDSGLVTGPFYPYTKSVTIDPSTLVILDAFYDPSTYMLDQKNIWTVRKHESNDILFRVYNKSVPFIFRDSGIYDVKVESYDSFGNLRERNFEGLIKVNETTG